MNRKIKIIISFLGISGALILGYQNQTMSPITVVGARVSSASNRLLGTGFFSPDDLPNWADDGTAEANFLLEMRIKYGNQQAFADLLKAMGIEIEEFEAMAAGFSDNSAQAQSGRVETLRDFALQIYNESFDQRILVRNTVQGAQAREAAQNNWYVNKIASVSTVLKENPLFARESITVTGRQSAVTNADSVSQQFDRAWQSMTSQEIPETTGPDIVVEASRADKMVRSTLDKSYRNMFEYYEAVSALTSALRNEKQICGCEIFISESLEKELNDKNIAMGIYKNGETYVDLSDLVNGGGDFALPVKDESNFNYAYDINGQRIRSAPAVDSNSNTQTNFSEFGVFDFSFMGIW